MLSCCGGVVLWCGRVSSFGRTDGRYVGLLRRAALRRDPRRGDAQERGGRPEVPCEVVASFAQKSVQRRRRRRFLGGAALSSRQIC